MALRANDSKQAPTALFTVESIVDQVPEAVVVVVLPAGLLPAPALPHHHQAHHPPTKMQACPQAKEYTPQIGYLS